MIIAYATKLRRRLIQEYGPRRTYTPGQIRTAVEGSNLNAEHIMYAYALYCPTHRFGEALGSGSPSFHEIREEIRLFSDSVVQPRADEGGVFSINGASFDTDSGMGGAADGGGEFDSGGEFDPTGFDGTDGH